MQRLLLGTILFIISLTALASSESYYSEVDFTIHTGLREKLHKTITKDHQSKSYKMARALLFGDLYLEQEKSGDYYVKDVYCEKNYSDNELRTKGGIGPGRIPNNRILNCEHTWPKSRFGGKRGNPKSAPFYNQKVADLHHLFPSESKMNGIRGNREFGEVSQLTEELPCSNTSKFGVVALGQNKFSHKEYFEPPRQHKGNVARALFYFAVRYNLSIDSIEEVYLRRWHIEDPVDEEEAFRNDRIHEIQGNRNPFIDHPELAGLIKDF